MKGPDLHLTQFFKPSFHAGAGGDPLVPTPDMTAAFTGLRLGAARARRGLRIENRSSSRRRPPLFEEVAIA
ncbi:MAG: hypothetical protein E6G03_12560 [Actinobacteria bacterium]|nr:MAG: hypothetical protein E6G03_12560 [Actinomycetota bacterium]